MNARIISACRHLRALLVRQPSRNARTHGCIHEPHGQSILALTSPGTYMNPENHGEITGFTPVDASFAGGEYYMNRRTQVSSIGFPYADNIACNASNRVPSYAHHDASPSAVAPPPYAFWTHCRHPHTVSSHRNPETACWRGCPQAPRQPWLPTMPAILTAFGLSASWIMRRSMEKPRPDWLVRRGLWLKSVSNHPSRSMDGLTI